MSHDVLITSADVSGHAAALLTWNRAYSVWKPFCATLTRKQVNQFSQQESFNSLWYSQRTTHTLIQIAERHL